MKEAKKFYEQGHAANKMFESMLNKDIETVKKEHEGHGGVTIQENIPNCYLILTCKQCDASIWIEP